MQRTNIDELLAQSRRNLERLDPHQSASAVADGATFDRQSLDSQISRDGTIPGAVVIARNVLEWRLDPSSDARLADAPALGDHVILFCNEGYASSLAAATLQEARLHPCHRSRRRLSGVA